MKEHFPKITFAIAAGAILFGASLAGSQALAYAPEGDLMKIKGYSPEVIDTANSQRSRQEWKEPSAPKQTPMEKFFHNIYYGNWTGGVDDFGAQVIREH
ncbi:MAG: hypothetical protein K0Q50_1126 [Vampirovibrio sp.]|nr:hypothetical protein [Vampirovibrio sp.]